LAFHFEQKSLESCNLRDPSVCGTIFARLLNTLGITDLMMPRMKGTELVSHLRETGPHATINSARRRVRDSARKRALRLSPWLSPTPGRTGTQRGSSLVCVNKLSAAGSDKAWKNL